MLIATVIAEIGVTVPGIPISRCGFLVHFLGFGEFSLASCRIVYTSFDTRLDGWIGQNFLFRFAAGGKRERTRSK